MRCHGIGRLTKDPELRQVKDTHVCTFSLAIERHFGKGENAKSEVNFFDFVAWDNGAETIAKYCKKGYQLAVDAVAVQDRWEDKETNKQRSRVQFRVTNFELLNNRKSEAAPASAPEPAPAPAAPSDDAPF